jgi:hypothetical protein
MLNPIHWIILLILPLCVSIWAAAVILGKAGYSPWLAILTVIPGMIFVGMILLAVLTWPLERAAEERLS